MYLATTPRWYHCRPFISEPIPPAISSAYRNPCRRRSKSEPPNQDRKVITLENWALIGHLYCSEGESMRSIAERLEILRNTMAKAVASTDPPRYQRTAAPNSLSISPKSSPLKGSSYRHRDPGFTNL